jgi:hypothetical protein
MNVLNKASEWLKKRFKISENSLLNRKAYARSTARAVPATTLIKDRPLSLEERYRVIDDARHVETVFKRLAAPLMELCDAVSAKARQQNSGRVVLRELGTTDDRRSYVFMKPMNEYGWLIERGGAGWRVSRAEKIIGADMFMRSNADPWDLVTLWQDPKGEGLTRVKSQRFGHELMTVTEYERRLTDALREVFTSGEAH